MDVYPTAPFGSQVQQSNVDTPTSQSESSGSSKTVLSKVKQKAKKLKNKIKKVTGSNSSPAESDRKGYNDALRRDGEEVGNGAEWSEDDAEDDDLSKQHDNLLNKYEQLRSIDALDKPGDGSEGEIHGGVPVSAAPLHPGTYWGSAGDKAPITPFKSAGPPDTLQAAPTEYRNYAADDDHLVASGEEKSASSTPRRSQGDVTSRDLVEGRSSVGIPFSPEVDTSKLSPHHEPAEAYQKHDSSKGLQGDASSTGPDNETSQVRNPTWLESDTSKSSSGHLPAQFHPKQTTSDTPPIFDGGNSYPENLVKSDSSFVDSKIPIHDNAGVSDEDSSADGRLGSGNVDEDLVNPNPVRDSQCLADDKDDNASDSNSGLPTDGKLGLSTPDYNSGLPTDGKLGLGTPYTSEVDGDNPDDLVEPNSVFENSKLPVNDKTAMLNENKPSPAGKVGLGISNTPSASDVDESYPEDLVKPNPSFGKSKSPTHDKIAVMNEDLSADRKLGLGLSSSDNYSGSSKGDLVHTSVPEFSELREYQGSPSASAVNDNLVYRPISDPEAKSPVTSDLKGMVDGDDGEQEAITQGSRSGPYPDNSVRTVQDEEGENQRSVDEESVSPLDAHSSEAQLSHSYGSDTRISDTTDEGASALTEQPLPHGEKQEDNNISPAGAYSSEAQYARPCGSGEMPIVDAAREHTPALRGDSVDGESVAASKNDRERWGKSSADESGDMRDVNTALTSDELGDEGKLRQTSSDQLESKLHDEAKVADDAGRVQVLQSTDTGSEPGASKNMEEDEEEFYDPNEVKDDQFQEGFAHGAGEEGILSDTLAGSAIGKLQGLRDAVTSSLGYPKQDDSSGAGGEESSVLEGEEGALSPSKQQPRAGLVGGLRDTVASSLGYGNVSPRSASNNKIVSKTGEEHEVDAAGDGQQQPQGGVTLKGLKNVFASKLGYGGVSEESPASSKGSEFPQTPAAEASPTGTVDDVEENRDGVGHVASNNDHLHAADQQRGGGLLEGVKGLLSSKLGYSNQTENITERSPSEAASVPSGTSSEHPSSVTQNVPSETSEQPSSYTQKLFNTTAAARDYLSSTGGNGKEDKTDLANKDDKDNSHLDTGIESQHDTASKVSPSEDDKALSALITDTLSSTANTVGEKLGWSRNKQSPSAPTSQAEQ